MSFVVIPGSDLDVVCIAPSGDSCVGCVSEDGSMSGEGIDLGEGSSSSKP